MGVDIPLPDNFENPLKDLPIDPYKMLDHVKTAADVHSYLSFFALALVIIVAVFKLLRTKQIKKEQDEQNEKDNSLLRGGKKNQFEMAFVDEEEEEEIDPQIEILK